MADWTKGFDRTDPRTTHSPKRKSNDDYLPPGSMAEAQKRRWNDVPGPYPYGENDEGGGGGGDG